MNELFIDKYAPKTLSDVQGQQSAINKLVTYFDTFSAQKKKGIIIYGPSGTGKTVSIHALARQYNYDVLEINADSDLSKDELEKKIIDFSKTGSLFGKKKFVLIEEVESFASGCRGAMGIFSSLVKSSKVPMVFIAADLWDEKLKTLKLICDSVQFGTLLPATIKKQLIKILALENIEFDEVVPEFLSRNSAGDMRVAMTDLQSISCGKKKVSASDVADVEARFKPSKVFDFVKDVFKSDPKVAFASLEHLDMDFDSAFLWLVENVTSEFKDPVKIASAFDYLSRSDIFSGRVMKRDEWSMQKYAEGIAIAGLSSLKSSKTGYTAYTYPSKIAFLGKTKSFRTSQKDFCTKVAPMLHLSSLKCIKNYLPYLSWINQNSKVSSKKIFDSMGLEKEDLEIFDKRI